MRVSIFCKWRKAKICQKFVNFAKFRNNFDYCEKGESQKLQGYVISSTSWFAPAIHDYLGLKKMISKKLSYFVKKKFFHSKNKNSINCWSFEYIFLYVFFIIDLIFHVFTIHIFFWLSIWTTGSSSAPTSPKPPTTRKPALKYNGL